MIRTRPSRLTPDRLARLAYPEHVSAFIVVTIIKYGLKSMFSRQVPADVQALRIRDRIAMRIELDTI